MAFPSALPSQEPLSFWDVQVSVGKAGRAACQSQQGSCTAGELQGEQGRGLRKAGWAPLQLPPSGLVSCDKNYPSRSALLQEVRSCHPISHIPPRSLQAGEVAAPGCAEEGGTQEQAAPAILFPASPQCHQQSAYREESLRAAPVVCFARGMRACSRQSENKPTIPTINPLFVPLPHPSAREFVPCAAQGGTNS